MQAGQKQLGGGVGWGRGSGRGSGTGTGTGTGRGVGWGSGSGDGSGTGWGEGWGSGTGKGSGWGSGAAHNKNNAATNKLLVAHYGACGLYAKEGVAVFTGENTPPTLFTTLDAARVFVALHP